MTPPIEPQEKDKFDVKLEGQMSSPPVGQNELRLELKALKSDMRLLIIASVALNQFLANVDLPREITAVALLGFAGKAAYGYFASKT